MRKYNILLRVSQNSVTSGFFLGQAAVVDIKICRGRNLGRK